MTLLLDEPAVHRRDVGVVRVTGPDRRSYLHTLLSQSLEDARAGDVADFLHLDAKGGVKAMGRAVVHAEAVLLVTPPGVAGSLAAELEQFKFLLEVEAADVSDAWGLASVRGPAVAVEVPGARSEPMTAAPHGAGLVIRDRSGGADLLGARDWVDERVDGLGLPEADARQWEAWRIRQGIPAWGAEVVAGRRPQELGLLPTHVHLRKGCYPGQESIAKTYNLGRPRRALAVVELDAAVPVGASVVIGGGTGELTSVAASPGGTVALAMLPVDRDTGDIRGDGTLTAGDVDGRVLQRVGAGVPQPGAPVGARR
jgi:tRNA-modifying protein YgfZ